MIKLFLCIFRDFMGIFRIKNNMFSDQNCCCQARSVDWTVDRTK